MRSRFLFYHTGAIGDFITILPAVGALREKFPDREFLLIGRPSIGALGLNRFYFDQILNADRAAWAGLFSHAEPSAELVGVLKSTEKAFLWTASNSMPQRLGELGVPRVYFQKPFPSSAQHAVDYHLDLVRDLVPVSEGCFPKVFPSLEDRALARALTLSGWVVLHPGSGSPKKNWPLISFLELADRLSRNGRKVAWVVGPAEEESGLARQLPGRVLPQLDLPVLAAALESCSLHIGNDSGISHLAAASGAPTLALFGSTDPAIWAPRGPKVRVAGGFGMRMDRITVEEAAAIARAMLLGRPGTCSYEFVSVS